MVLLGYAAAMAYLFLRVSRCGDYFGYFLAGLRVPLAVLALAMIAALVSGRFMNAVLSRMGMRYMALTFVFLLSSAFSIWPGGSVNQFNTFWPPTLIMFLVLSAFLTTVRGLQTALNSLGFGIGIAAVYVLATGGADDLGRFSATGMAYANSNDLALVMGLGAPALMFIMADPSRGLFSRLAAVPLLLASVIVLVKTGSRGGMLGFLAVILFLLVQLPWAIRLRVFAGVAVLAIVAISTAPRETLVRFTTVFEAQRAVDPISDVHYGNQGEQDRNHTGIAAASAEGRWYLMKQAVVLFMRNPVLGVGFGMFAVGENELAIEAGAVHGSWKSAHNMYLQVASENGLPGLLLFLSILVASWKTFRFHRQAPPNPTPQQRALRHLGFAFASSMVCFLVAGTFLTVAYDYFIGMYAAFAVGMDNVYALEQQRTAESPEDRGSPIEGARGQIDWTQAPVGAPAQARQGA